jgi:hypothetical protein
MLYIYMVKKNQGDKGLSGLLQLIHAYSGCYGQDDFVLCFPGFLSKTKNTIESFAKDFPVNGRALGNQKGYFLPGVNGHKPVPKMAGVSLVDYANSFYGGYSCTLPFKKDHAKIAFFLDGKDFPLGTKLDVALAKSNLDNLRVKAVALGSSNQSYSTYYRKTAYMGEADVFLVDESVFSTSAGSKQTTNHDDDALGLIDGLHQSTHIVVSRQIGQSDDLLSMFKNCLE